MAVPTRPANPAVPGPPRAARGRVRTHTALRRVGSWYYTGPVGHLIAGTLDVGELFARLAYERARGRRVEWF